MNRIEKEDVFLKIDHDASGLRLHLPDQKVATGNNVDIPVAGKDWDDNKREIER
jgi:hypothetical protein